MVVRCENVSSDSLLLGLAQDDTDRECIAEDNECIVDLLDVSPLLLQ